MQKASALTPSACRQGGTTKHVCFFGFIRLCTYREQHDGDSQSDGGEDSQTDQQQHGVELVNLGEGVEQLCLHVVCVGGDTKEHNVKDV